MNPAAGRCGVVSPESEVPDRIEVLVEEEHTLRGRGGHDERDEIAGDSEQRRLRDVKAYRQVVTE